MPTLDFAFLFVYCFFLYNKLELLAFSKRTEQPKAKAWSLAAGFFENLRVTNFFLFPRLILSTQNMLCLVAKKIKGGK